MPSIANLSDFASTHVRAESTSQRPANASGELAKLESQLSDWVHCPSGETSAGKAKIAEITDKIDAIEVKVKTADEAKVASARSEADQPQRSAAQSLRFDGQGAWLNVQA